MFRRGAADDRTNPTSATVAATPRFPFRSDESPNAENSGVETPGVETPGVETPGAETRAYVRSRRWPHPGAPGNGHDSFASSR